MQCQDILHEQGLPVRQPEREALLTLTTREPTDRQPRAEELPAKAPGTANPRTPISNVSSCIVEGGV